MRTSLTKKVALLQAKTVARGATEAEAQAAAAKVTELTQGEQRAEAAAHLKRLGWSEQHARGIVAGLDRLPPWQAKTDWRFGVLWDWASAHGHRDPTTLETQLRFLSDDLRNSHHRVGSAVSAAKTEQEATKAFKPYSDKFAA